MPFGDKDWKRRNPECFELMGDQGDRYCECGELLVSGGRFRATQDHPWRPPRVECDCGQIHQIVGLRCECEDQEDE